MGKSYDEYVTPQNTPRFRERRIILLIAMGLLTTNLIAFAILFPASRPIAITGTIFTAGWTFIQYFDNRISVWSWGYIITWCVLDILMSAGLVFWFHVYWYLCVIAAETLICCLVGFAILKPKYKKRR